MITEQLYMYITDSPDQFWIDSYTKYITTLDGFADMFIDIIENEDDYLSLEGDLQYSLSSPDEKGYIKIIVSGKDCLGDQDTVERGLIPVKFYS